MRDKGWEWEQWVCLMWFLCVLEVLLVSLCNISAAAVWRCNGRCRHVPVPRSPSDEMVSAKTVASKCPAPLLLLFIVIISEQIPM